jgi:PAS domain S-box-containing protein
MERGLRFGWLLESILMAKAGSPIRSTDLRVDSDLDRLEELIASLTDSGERAEASRLLADLRVEREQARQMDAGESERQRLAEEIRAQKDLLERLVEEAPAGIAFLKGPDHRFTLVNAVYQRIARGKGDLIGKTVNETWPEIAGDVVPLMDKVFRSGEPYRASGVRFMIVRNGQPEENFFNFTFTPFLDPNGKTEGIMILALEITEQEHNRRAMLSEQARLQTVFENMPVGVMVADEQARLVLTNPVADRLTKQRPPIGQPISSLAVFQATYPNGEIVPVEELPLVRAALHGESSHGVELKITQPDGQQCPILVNCAPIYSASGEISGAVAVFQDMTEIKQMESQLTEALQQVVETAEQLERSNRDLRDFAFHASHDLQEPLRKIQSFGTLLLENTPELDAQSRDYIGRMQDAAGRMKGMIDDLLSYSRVSTKAQPYAQIDLNQVAQEVLEDLELRVRETSGRVTLESLPNLDADPLQMRQLLQNLIGNALKFHRPGVPPEVRVSGRVLGGANPARVELRVEDNGIGFDDQHTDRIFQPFARLHGRSAYEGTGMGLAICRRIVERHGGTIESTSRPGEGSVFTVVLPKEHPDEGPLMGQGD